VFVSPVELWGGRHTVGAATR